MFQHYGQPFLPSGDYSFLVVVMFLRSVSSDCIAVGDVSFSGFFRLGYLTTRFTIFRMSNSGRRSTGFYCTSLIFVHIICFFDIYRQPITRLTDPESDNSDFTWAHFFRRRTWTLRRSTLISIFISQFIKKTLKWSILL